MTEPQQQPPGTPGGMRTGPEHGAVAVCRHCREVADRALAEGGRVLPVVAVTGGRPIL